MIPSRLLEHLMHKNRLQEYAQRSSIALPIYQTVNEGYQHAPRFRATVLVDGETYTSSNTYSHRKAAEQDVAKLALECISKKIKDEGSPLIIEAKDEFLMDAIYCKSILNEFAVKMTLERPNYNTIQPEGSLPAFISYLVFNDVTYTGEVGKSKKEAEQLAARAVIRSLLGTSGFGTILFEIIKSKGKLFDALRKVKGFNYGPYGTEIQTAIVTANVQTANVQTPNVALNVQTPNVAHNLQTPNVTANVEAANVTANVQDANVQTPNVAHNVQTPSVTANVQAANVTANVQAANVHAANVHAANVQDASVQDANVHAANVQAANVQDANVHAANVQDANVHAANVTANVQASNVTANMQTSATPGTSLGLPLPHHQFKIPKAEPSSETVNLPISFVPSVLQQPSGVGPSTSKKRRKNKNKANKRFRADAELAIVPQSLAVVPHAFTQAPQPFTQAPQSFSQSPQPFTQAPQSFSQSPQPFTQAPQSFSQSPQPFTQAPQSFSQSPQSFSQAPPIHLIL
ncbi:hypothetical protein EZV62_004894 [Acer yangbiense]|uniref:DRBM domain-containing protein n=1 Tax=Acer yangbiense TaxID=1000413 RepID=A0A5C7ILJ8_9ROSI|nr:hypothetical protein EZV62_004894 [Acer yangbiense]